MMLFKNDVEERIQQRIHRLNEQYAAGRKTRSHIAQRSRRLRQMLQHVGTADDIKTGAWLLMRQTAVTRRGRQVSGKRLTIPFLYIRSCPFPFGIALKKGPQKKTMIAAVVKNAAFLRHIRETGKKVQFPHRLGDAVGRNVKCHTRLAPAGRGIQIILAVYLFDPFRLRGAPFPVKTAAARAVAHRAFISNQL